MSWVRIWAHLVFATKNREPFLNKKIRSEVFQHVAENAKKKDIWLDSINGYAEHAHCLLALNKDQSIAQVVQLIKGESSYWINQNKLTENKFIWQDDYWAVSVSESHLKQTRSYIHNQEAHHELKTFEKEIEIFMNKYGWEHIKS